MEKLYKIMIQANCFSTPLKTQLVRDLGQLCKYHQQIGYDIDRCEEFDYEVKRVMILGMLRQKGSKKDVVIGMITCQDKKFEVCRYQPTMKEPSNMILIKPTYINSKN
jgi:hypothetical protein